MNILHWLHTFEPQAVLAVWGPVTIYWYGLIMAVAMLAAIMAAIWLGRLYSIKAETIIDLAFWLIIGGLICARIYYVILEWPYYQNDWLAIFKVWQGGLAIHGGLLGGLLVLWLFARKYQQSFWTLASILAPAVALGQAIGRWGNYFNQELYGFPTGAVWSIPISPLHRPAAYLQYQYFHPTFLYESICTLGIFIFLVAAHLAIYKHKQRLEVNQRALTLCYLVFYCMVRFVLEDFRIDEVPSIGLWRWPQIFSMVIAVASLTVLIYFAIKQKGREDIENNLPY